MSCPYTLVGDQLTTLLESEDSTLTGDGEGVQKAIVTYRGLWPNAVNQVQDITVHPDFPDLLRSTFSAKRVSPEQALITINFEGVVITSEGGIVRKYSLDGSTGTEPIETHPEFAVFGGAPFAGVAGPNNSGAVYDKDGTFKGFAVEPPGIIYYADLNRTRAGVKSFLAPGAIYSEKTTYSSSSIPTAGVLNLTKLGKIDIPPASRLLPEPASVPPKVGGDFTWLLIKHVASEAGDGLQVDRAWRLSGEAGWDIDIYI